MSVFDFEVFGTTDGYSGTASLISSDSITVTIPEARPDTDYHIAVTAVDVSCPGLYVANRTTTTFDIKNPTPATVDIDWVMRF